MTGFRSPFRPHFFLTFALLVPALFAPAAARAADDLAERRAALKRVIDDQWEYVLSTHPEFASMLGDKRWNDQAFEVSPAHVARDRATSREILARLKAIDRLLRDSAHRLKDHDMPSGYMPEIDVVKAVEAAKNFRAPGSFF